MMKFWKFMLGIIVMPTYMFVLFAFNIFNKFFILYYSY